MAIDTKEYKIIFVEEGKKNFLFQHFTRRIMRNPDVLSNLKIWQRNTTTNERQGLCNATAVAIATRGSFFRNSKLKNFNLKNEVI